MNESARPVALAVLLLGVALGGCGPRAEAPLKGATLGGRSRYRRGRAQGQRPRFRRQDARLFRLTFCRHCPTDMASSAPRFAVRGGRRRKGGAGAAALHQRHPARDTPKCFAAYRRLPPPLPRPHRRRGGDRPGRPPLRDFYSRHRTRTGPTMSITSARRCSRAGGAPIAILLRPAERVPCGRRGAADSSGGCDEDRFWDCRWRARPAEGRRFATAAAMLPAQLRGATGARPDQRRLPAARPDQLPLQRL